MIQNKTTFVSVLTATMIAIFCFAYFFYTGFYGTVSASDSGIYVSASAPIPPGSQGFASPAKLSIPSISVDAKVQKVGLTAQGAMGIPTNFVDVGWYMHGTIPGEVGSAVMGGHVDNALGLKGVFKYLKDVKVGDDIYITDTNGTNIHFVVKSVKIYPYDEVPEEEIFHSDKTLLQLITCGGKWIREKKTYDERVVVTAEYIP